MIDKKPSIYTPGQGLTLERNASRGLKLANIGASIMNYNFSESHIKVLSDKSIVNRKGELFKRMKTNTLAALIKKDRKIMTPSGLPGEFDSISNYGREPTERGSVDNSDVNYMDHLETESYSKVSGVSGVSRISGVSCTLSQLGMNNDTEYLLFDLRERDAYDLYHIYGARHFPGPNISREKFAPELYQYRNQIGKLIVVYHQDEKNGTAYAAMLFDKGFENVYLLTGGIEAFVQDAPNLLQGKKIPRPEKSVNSNYIFKRSNFRERPKESDVIIPSNYIIEENKSYVSSLAAQPTEKRGKSMAPDYESKISSPYKSYKL